MKFINNLKQIICFNILSVSGFLIFLFQIFGFIILFHIDYQNSIDREWGGIDAIAFTVITTFLYFLISAIIFILGLIEYFIKKKKGKLQYSNKNTFYTYIFILGFVFLLITFAGYFYIFILSLIE